MFSTVFQNFTLRKFAYVFPKVKLSAISPQALSRDPQIVRTLTYFICSALSYDICLGLGLFFGVFLCVF